MAECDFKIGITFPVFCQLLRCDVLRLIYRSKRKTVTLFWLKCPSHKVNERHHCSPQSAKWCPFKQIFRAVFLIRPFLNTVFCLSVFQWHFSPSLPQRHAPFQFKGRWWTLLQTAWTHQPFHAQGKSWVPALNWGPRCEFCLLCIAGCYSVTEHHMSWMCCMRDRQVKECLEFIISLELVPFSYIRSYMINSF